MSTACTIENIECFTQVEAQSGSMVFVLHDAAGKAAHTLGMFHRSEQRWYAPLSYPNRTASPLVPDEGLSALRTILFLNGAADILPPASPHCKHSHASPARSSAMPPKGFRRHRIISHHRQGRLKRFMQSFRRPLLAITPAFRHLSPDYTHQLVIRRNPRRKKVLYCPSKPRPNIITGLQ